MAAIMEIMNYRILTGGREDSRGPADLEKDGQYSGRLDEVGVATTQISVCQLILGNKAGNV